MENTDNNTQINELFDAIKRVKDNFDCGFISAENSLYQIKQVYDIAENLIK